ncbi:hypothetical protein B0T19DRAFT_440983 [Cercophora scortea]|uniref:Uncharacterized protein n=1 Tax=Cercophora scortea TaxID=314031 RepID=A0AAE0MCA9_9PEZI|nr:hypothetical protein B0T19DRAFT_440983 [Cercophora scortea]
MATATSTSSMSTMSSLPEPPKANPSHHTHNRDLALQKYLLLHEQHESLRQHLDELRPLPIAFKTTMENTTSAISPTLAPLRTASTTSLCSTATTQSRTSVGPTSGSLYHQPSRRQSLPPKMACSLAGGTDLATVPDETTLSEVAVEEAKLCHVNEGIKRTLTELLNCETVRADRAFRTWVQCRLMDTERELRSGRRRRSAPEP